MPLSASTSARRAAKFGLSMWPMNDAMIPDYEEACAEFGVKDYKFIRGITSVYVTDDPERGWAEVGDHLVHYMRSYAKWSESPDTSASPLHGMDSIEKIRAAGLVRGRRQRDRLVRQRAQIGDDISAL